MSRKTVWLILAAGLTAAAVLLLIQWSHRWDHPQQIERTEIYRGKLKYRGRQVDLSIACLGCPSALIGSRKDTLRFDFTLKESPQAVYDQGATAAAAPEGAERYVYVWVEAANASLRLQSDSNTWPIGPVSGLQGELENNLPLEITPSGGETVTLAFHFESWDRKNSYDIPSLGVATYEPPTRQTFVKAVLPQILLSLMVFAVVLGALLWSNGWHRQLRSRTEQDLAKVQGKPWETAQIKLEEYFSRNLFQVNLVFWGAIAVTAGGFVIIFIGIFMPPRTSGQLGGGEWVTACGVITQFVGATFMVIYRSVMKQASEFMRVLDRINNVGMAVTELDQVPDEPPQLKNDIRSHFVELLLGGNNPAAVAADGGPKPPRGSQN